MSMLPIDNKKTLSAALALCNSGDLNAFAVKSELFTTGEFARFRYHMTQLNMVPTMCGSILICTKEA